MQKKISIFSFFAGIGILSELNRILESLGLPILLKTDQEVILKNDNAELNLELGKKVQIVKARKKVYLETY